MHGIKIQVLRVTDHSFPGWVECLLVDAQREKHFFIVKIPYLASDDEITPKSDFPKDGVIRCELAGEYIDDKGRKIVTASTENPDGVESLDEISEFHLLPYQLTKLPDVKVVFEFNGTRKHHCYDGYRPAHLVKDDYLTSGEHHYYDTDSVPPDGTAKGTITFITPEAYPGCLWNGKRISIQEGAKIIGYATITHIFNPALKSDATPERQGKKNRLRLRRRRVLPFIIFLCAVLAILFLYDSSQIGKRIDSYGDVAVFYNGVVVDQNVFSGLSRISDLSGITWAA